MHPHEKLDEIIGALVTQTLTRTCYRVVKYEDFSTKIPPDPLYSLGPGANGQRFTPKGGPPALYISEDYITAIAESLGVSRTEVVQGGEIKFNPAVTYCIEAHLECVIDLTLPQVQQALGTSVAELTSSWAMQLANNVICPTHVLAEAIYKNDSICAIRYPAKASNEHANIMIWTDKIYTPSLVEVYDTSKKLCVRIPPA
jgi:RES domain-containing protein